MNSPCWPSRTLRAAVCGATLALMSAGAHAASDGAGARVNFAREVRPILARNCFHCHGPDARHRKAALRLDTREGAFEDLGDGFAFVPGKPSESQALRRMVSHDRDELMPPPDSRKSVTAGEIATVRAWIAEGAHYGGHWSFETLRGSVPPAALHPELVRNSVDPFVQERLARAGLTPSPQAPPGALVRRLAFDLTGLPPAPEDVAGLAADSSEPRYRALVEKYLASPAYGERWARVWLDLARYADSKGYEKDLRRTMWRYRDWVIGAFERDLPFDQFTVEQLAGDLLPGGRPEQLLATAFHRNTMTNDEGGTDDEEFRIAAVKDRVDTTLQVWMGLSAGCAKCHDHKYDPVSITDYYRLFAYFNQTEDADRHDDNPREAFADAEQQWQLDALAAAQADLRQRIARRVAGNPEFRLWQSRWLGAWRAPLRRELGGRPLQPVEPGVWYKAGPFVPVIAPGASTGLLAVPLPPEQRASLDKPVDALAAETYENGQIKWRDRPDWREGEPQLLEERENSVTFLARSWRLPSARAVVFSGSAADGMSVWLDGEPVASGQRAIVIRRALQAGEHRLVIKVANRSGKEKSVFRLTEERVGDLPVNVAAILLAPAARRAAADEQALAEYFLRVRPGSRPAAGPDPIAALDQLSARESTLREEFPRIPIMRELAGARRRATFVHQRGDFLTRGPEVSPGTPAAFPPPPSGTGADRLGLARWLVDAGNPLTARVAVNRHWAQFFGRGIVETEEDFGSQGAAPSHPELLDHLAAEFVRRGYSMKELCRMIVLSHTYRQDSRARPGLLARDRDNRLLARGPRFRLEAEVIRDAALAVAGLLSPKRFGPSVMPEQPDGIWKTVYSGDQWVTSAGEDRHRRSLYTFAKRTAPYPSLVAFDAPSRELCTVRRIRSNTPLQALVTLNDPVFVAAARGLARRVWRHADGNPATAIGAAFARALARDPIAAEAQALQALFDNRRRFYATQMPAALALAAPASDPAPEDLAGQAVAIAALTAVANVILNLDEFLTKG